MDETTDTIDAGQIDESQKRIVVQFKTIFGVDKIYPVDEDSKLFARLAGTTTLTQEAINLIKQLGYTVEIKQNERTTL